MKNITISVEEELLRWAKIWAAGHDSSISRLVADLLRERMLQEAGYDQAMREDKVIERSGYRSAGRWTREELHDRALLRR